MTRIFSISVLLVVLCASGGFAAEDNCLKNGDFEKGKMGWKTEPGLKVVEMMEKPADGSASTLNHVLKAGIHKSRKRTVQTRIKVKSKTKALIISMRVKTSKDFESATPSAEQLTLRMERSNRSATLSSRPVEKKDEWQEIKWTFSDFQGSSILKFLIVFNPGQGAIYLDDVVVKQE